MTHIYVNVYISTLTKQREGSNYRQSLQDAISKNNRKAKLKLLYTNNAQPSCRKTPTP